MTATDVEMGHANNSPRHHHHHDHHPDSESFPFDVVFVFDGTADHIARGLYEDFVTDGFFAAHSVIGPRIYVAVGASDRLLHRFNEVAQLGEVPKLITTFGGVPRIFSQAARQRIFWEIFRCRQYGGFRESLNSLVERKILHSYFCLHDYKKAHRVWKQAFSFTVFPDEDFLNKVHEYFGEEIAMYMNFLAAYTKFALPMAALGIAAGIIQIYEKYDSWVLPPYGFAVCVWACLLIEYWKRTQLKLANQYGTMDLEETEPVRDGYRGVVRKLEWFKHRIVDGQQITEMGDFEVPIQHTYAVHLHQHKKKHFVATTNTDPFAATSHTNVQFDDLPTPVFERHYPDWKRMTWFLLSVPTVLALCAAVVVAVYANDVLRDFWTDKKTGRLDPAKQTATSIFNAVFIVLLNAVYPIVAQKLTEWENHRTRTEHENALILKIFLFTFVNSYFPIIVTAFELYPIRVSKQQNKSAEARLQEMFYQILTVCVTQVASTNIRNLIIPFSSRIKTWLFDKCCYRKSASTEPIADDDDPASPTSVELNSWQSEYTLDKQYALSESDPILSRYQERIVLFGYCSMFAVVFPLGILFILIDNVILMKLEMARYLRLMQRGTARKCENIGRWQQCFQMLIVCSIVTNALLMSFTSDSLIKWYTVRDTEYARLTFFVVAEHLLFLVVWGAEIVIPDFPPSIVRLFALEKYRNAKANGSITYDPVEDMMKPTQFLEAHHDGSPCPECKLKFKKGEIVMRLHCLHLFHTECLYAKLGQLRHHQRHEEESPSSPLAVQNANYTCPLCLIHFRVPPPSETSVVKIIGAKNTTYVPITFPVSEVILTRDIARTVAEEHEELRRRATFNGLTDKDFPRVKLRLVDEAAAREGAREFEEAHGMNEDDEKNDDGSSSDSEAEGAPNASAFAIEKPKPSPHP